MRAMVHVEHFIHLRPVCSALFLYDAEQWRNGEKVVFYDAYLIHEVQDFCLRTARAMYHAMYLTTHRIEQLFYYRRVRAGEKEHQLSLDRKSVV